MPDNTARHAPTPCPQCGHVMDAATPADTRSYRPPVPGDVSICISCCAVNQYNGMLRLELIPEDVLNRMYAEPELGAELRTYVTRCEAAKTMRGGQPLRRAI